MTKWEKIKKANCEQSHTKNDRNVVHKLRHTQKKGGGQWFCDVDLSLKNCDKVEKVNKICV